MGLRVSSAPPAAKVTVRSVRGGFDQPSSSTNTFGKSNTCRCSLTRRKSMLSWIPMLHTMTELPGALGALFGREA